MNEILNNKYNNTINEYKKSYSNYITAIQNKEDSTTINQYKSQMNDYNTLLKKINSKILNKINNSVSIYKEGSENTAQKRKILLYNADELKKEKEKIKRILNEDVVLEKTSHESELETNATYSQYIFLFIIVIMLLLLLFLSSK
tara:strand:+ start:3416 stop:3847 length:432 start_codon:yes stop_codon:yes gene_type:complete